jgi:catalase
MPKDRTAPDRSKGAAKSTVSGPKKSPRGPGNGPAERKMHGVQALAAEFPFNASKAGEIGAAARTPRAGTTAEPREPAVLGSTLSEKNTSSKTGAPARAGLNPGNQPLDRVRVDSGGEALTTNFAQPIADNQNSLKAGLRGPTLLEDFILREKLTHFDHERIPERIVHARGSAAHGFFECNDSLAKSPRAAFLTAMG